MAFCRVRRSQIKCPHRPNLYSFPQLSRERKGGKCTTTSFGFLRTLVRLLRQSSCALVGGNKKYNREKCPHCLRLATHNYSPTRPTIIFHFLVPTSEGGSKRLPGQNFRLVPRSHFPVIIQPAGGARARYYDCKYF